MFGVDRRQADGLNIWCKPCRRLLDKQRGLARSEEQIARDREVAAAWLRNNPDKVKQYRAKHVPAQRAQRQANPEKVNAENRKRYWADVEKNRQQKRAQYEKHKCSYLERANRRQRNLEAHPAFDADLDELVRLEAKGLVMLRGPEWEVDHIVPIKHKDACGLHNAHNLQVVPRAWNRSKGNRTMDRYFTVPDLLVGRTLSLTANGGPAPARVIG